MADGRWLTAPQFELLSVRRLRVAVPERDVEAQLFTE